MDRPKQLPTVCTLPPGVPFLASLARGLVERFATDEPLDLARVTVFLPTRRAVRGLHDALRMETAARGQKALLLPEICALGDVDEDEIILSLPRNDASADDIDLPPAIGEIRRQTLLARLIERWSQDRHRAGDAFATMGPAQAMALADTLAQLIDHLYTEDVRLDGLTTLVPAQYSEHWQKTVEFLSILSDHWPAILHEEKAIDKADRRNRLLLALARRWQATPPPHPVIAAGSTGSIPATAELLKVIAHLPRGAVLLPGLDRDLNEKGWSQLEPTHPQYGLRHLLETLGVCRNEVTLWDGNDTKETARARLWSTVFLPAPATEQWPDFAPEAVSADALQGLYRIEAEDPAQEAGAIACILRRTLETPGRTAALVTPDRDLARRVAAELRRWRIDIDDSAGQPLAGTRTGIFLRSLLEAVESRFAPVALLSLLKHELCCAGMTPAARLAAISDLERAFLRGLKPAPGLDALKSRLERRAAAGSADLTDALTLIVRVAGATAPLRRLSKAGFVPLCELAQAHMDAAEALANTEGTEPLWEGDDGAVARDLFDQLVAQEDGPEWKLADYALAVTRALQVRPVHRRRPGHPRLFIWGPLEARLQHADVMILGSLNEGTWPAPPRPDPWMNRRMQSDLGLPDPERRIGQAAHDITQLASAGEVYLTRAAKAEGAPQLPSRWLLRLDAVLKAAGQEPRVLTPNEDLTAIFRQIDRRGTRVRISDPRPAPPAQARPVRLPVTAVETLIRDPYAVYARHVLDLRVLKPLEAEPGAGERGTFVHDALHRFTERFADGLPEDKSAAEQVMAEEGAAALKRAIGPEWLYPAAHLFWRARFDEAAAWFLDWEYDRRAVGTQPLFQEISGEMTLNCGRGFTLTARADRIDRLDGGGHAILDYKTGRTPSDKEVGAGFAPQLPLEGAILEAGGFDGTGTGRAEVLLYVMLAGGRTPGHERIITGGKGSAQACIAASLAGLKSLIAQYHDPHTPFLSRPHVQFLGQRSDFDHLARVKEWSAGGEEGGE